MGPEAVSVHRGHVGRDAGGKTRSALWAQSPQQSYLPVGVKAGDWALIGHDLHNTRFNPYENTIAPNNVSRLKVKWTFDLAGILSKVRRWWWKTGSTLPPMMAIFTGPRARPGR